MADDAGHVTNEDIWKAGLVVRVLLWSRMVWAVMLACLPIAAPLSVGMEGLVLGGGAVALLGLTAVQGLVAPQLCECMGRPTPRAGGVLRASGSGFLIVSVLGAGGAVLMRSAVGAVVILLMLVVSISIAEMRVQRSVLCTAWRLGLDLPSSWTVDWDTLMRALRMKIVLPGLVAWVMACFVAIGWLGPIDFLALALLAGALVGAILLALAVYHIIFVYGSPGVWLTNMRRLWMLRGELDRLTAQDLLDGRHGQGSRRGE